METAPNMFAAETYIARRRGLAEQFNDGLLLFIGNGLSLANGPATPYPFRQDSSFLYYWGLDFQDLAAVIDIDAGGETVFGNDPDADNIVWTGPQIPLSEQCRRIGVATARPLARLFEVVAAAIQAGRRVRFLPPYRHGTRFLLESLTGIRADALERHASTAFIRAVIAQRSVKSDEELREIERAVDLSGEMHVLAMPLARPDADARAVAAAMAQRAYGKAGCRLAYPSIVTVRGEILHSLDHVDHLSRGDLVVNDTGAESPRHYASDITRTIPVGGRFSPRQRDIYALVLNAQQRAIDALGPGTAFKDVHRTACRALVEGLTDLGLMRGDTDAAVKAGAHALFFPHGVGHMMGLDVHDMEDLGEDLVGYTAQIPRSEQFGTRWLRLARPLAPGFVVTVEPGIYFIGSLIDRWRAENRFAAFIDYAAIEEWRDIGGIRIEDNFAITADGSRLLGRPIPKAIDAVEALASSDPAEDADNMSR
jgi:Xaa-Pro aminopeptidase